jgi:hypothetical protein
VELTPAILFFYYPILWWNGRERLVALPVNPIYEPWTREIVEYFQKVGEGLVFPFTRQYVGKVMRKGGIFNNLSYPIEPYVCFNNGTARKVDLHRKHFRLHALRSLRASELVDFYGLTLEELSTYGGWKIKSLITNASNVMTDRYLHLRWQGYFKSLCKPLIVNLSQIPTI